LKTSTTDFTDGSTGERVYFPGLDGLRALAIAMVYLFHDTELDLLSYLTSWVSTPLAMAVDPVLERLGLPDISFRVQTLLTRPFRLNGWVGVQVFFVLSGFLITTLLLRERERFGRIDLLAFWVRRALRIWPLYYLIVMIGFFVIPLARSGTQTPDGLWAFLLFAGNWWMIAVMPPPFDSLSVLWSVCVEEQFYLFVPLLVAWVAPRFRVPTVVGSMVVAVVTRYMMARSGITGVALRYNSLVNLDTLFAGVLLALVLRDRPALGRVVWPWRILVILGCVGLATMKLCQGEPWRMAIDQVLIWVWCIALIALAAQPSERLTSFVRRPSLVWLGKISYGLYLYHEISLGLVGKLMQIPSTFPDKAFILAVLAVLLTIAMASASYYGFERPFLRLKRVWTRVPSRPIDAEAKGKIADPERREFLAAGGPPGRPFARLLGFLTGPALIAIGLAIATIRAANAPAHPRRGPTVASPRNDIPEWVRKHESYVARARQGSVPLLFLGDSITLGWLGESLGSFDREASRRLWDSRFGSLHAENFGIDGDQVEHLLWRVEHGEIGSIEPEVVVVLIGTNNIGLDSPLAIAEGVAAVVDAIRERSPNTKILLLGLLPRGFTTGHGRMPVADMPDPRIAEVNHLLAPLGTRTEVTFLNPGERLLNREGMIDRAIEPDALHLSAKGYAILADAIEPTLVALLQYRMNKSKYYTPRGQS